MTDTIKNCTNCKNYHLLKPAISVCLVNNPLAQTPEYLVSGLVDDAINCVNSRSHGGVCGPTATLFVQK